MPTHRQAALADLARLAPHGNTLELAAGTGSYTAELLESADHVTAIDASPESLSLARTKLSSSASRLTLIDADVFRWRPSDRYLTIFFAYWLSHVPRHAFESFWRLVGDALAPRGRVFLIDSLGAQSNPGTPGVYREHDDLANQVSTRELNGCTYHVVKAAWSPRALETSLASLGWRARIVPGELSFWGLATRDESSA